MMENIPERDGLHPQMTTLVLPHLNLRVPVTYDARGVPWVPVSALCHVLGLDPTFAYHYVRHKLGWASAAKHWVHVGGRLRLVWCLPHPIGTASWFSVVYGRVADADLRTKLNSAINDGMGYLADARERSLRAYRQARADAHALVLALTSQHQRAERIRQHMAAASLQLSADTRHAIDALFEREQALYVESQPFLHQWFDSQRQQPLVRAFRVVEDVTEDSQSSQPPAPSGEPSGSTRDSRDGGGTGAHPRIEVVEATEMPFLALVSRADRSRLIELARDLGDMRDALNSYWRLLREFQLFDE